METKVIIDKVRPYRYLIILVIGFLIGTFINCEGEKEKVEVKTTIKYVDRFDTLVKEVPKVKYKYKDKIVYDLKLDTIMKDFVPNDYKYKWTKNDSLGDIYVSGWGNIDSLSVVCKSKDKIIEKEITKTIFKTPNTLYLSGEYMTPISLDKSLKPIYKANLDYSVRNKFIIGTSIGTNGDNWFIGGRIGVKIN